MILPPLTLITKYSRRGVFAPRWFRATAATTANSPEVYEVYQPTNPPTERATDQPAAVDIATAAPRRAGR